MPRCFWCSIWLGTSMPCSSMLVVQSRWGSCFFNAVNQRFNGAPLSSGLEWVVSWLRKWSMASQKAACAAGGSITVSRLIQARVHWVGHEGGDGARGVELARVARAAQVVEHLLVHRPDWRGL